MNTNKIALSGVLLGINMILLFGATMLPGIELTLFAMSSFVTAVVVMKASPKAAILFFVATSALGLILLPNKIALLPYVLFFGYYGIMKYYIEKAGIFYKHGKSGRIAEYLVKVLIFMMGFGSGILLFGDLFLAEIHLPEYPVVLLVSASVAAFIAYDYAFTLVIQQARRILKQT